jgi:hypothetical protein
VPASTPMIHPGACTSTPHKRIPGQVDPTLGDRLAADRVEHAFQLNALVPATTRHKGEPPTLPFDCRHGLAADGRRYQHWHECEYRPRLATHLLVATSATGAIASAVRADEPLLAARSGSVVERLSNARRRLEQHTDPARPLGEQASSGRRTRIKRRPAEAQLVAVQVPVDRFADAIGMISMSSGSSPRPAIVATRASRSSRKI